MSMCKVCKESFGEKKYYCSKSCQVSDWAGHKAYHQNHPIRKPDLDFSMKRVPSLQCDACPFDDDPYFKLSTIHVPGSTGMLGLVSSRHLPAGTSTPTGAALATLGKVAIHSSLGYIHDVEIVHEHSMRTIAKSSVHKEIISKLCGQESLSLLATIKKMTLSAWLVTGGNFSASSSAIAPHLHAIEPLPSTRDLPAKADHEQYYIRGFTPNGPIWAVRG